MGPACSDYQHGHFTVTLSAPLQDETLGTSMLYSSGTTGRPKGIIRPLPEQAPDVAAPALQFSIATLALPGGHGVPVTGPACITPRPQAAVNLTLRQGGTVVVMEKFEPLAYLGHIAQYQVSHSQLVPTMFSRMLKLDEATRRHLICRPLKLPFMRRRRVLRWSSGK